MRVSYALLFFALRFQDLSKAIRLAESNKKIQSLVLASSMKSTFSAGLDLSEMHDPDKLRLKDFWTSFQQLYIDLYGSRLACIAAIDGHAPAAGCMLALSCDYRIMSSHPKLSIGLNETKFGIAAPPFLARQMLETVGRRPGELAMAQGTLFSPQEALAMGLVDEVVDNVPGRALVVAKNWAKIPASGRVLTKNMVRRPAIDDLISNRQADLESFVQMVDNPSTQAALGAYFASLKKK